MTGLWRLVDMLCGALDADESAAVRGDLEESGASAGQALRDVLGLVARRQAGLWQDWRRWAIVAGIAPFALLLTRLSRNTAHVSSTYIWMYANNWNPDLLTISGFWRELAGTGASLFRWYSTLICVAWTVGFAAGRLAQRAVRAIGLVLCLILVASGTWGPAEGAGNGAHTVAFYRAAFPWIVLALLVLLPALWGMRQGRRSKAPLWLVAVIPLAALAVNRAYAWPAGSPIPWRQLACYWPVVYWLGSALRRRWTRAAAVALALAAIAGAQTATTVKAPLQPDADRHPAPEFALKDGSGRTVSLKQFRGKVVLLDFWATWCHGCKEEIPWFVEFQRRYAHQGLKVVGVSMDDDGWKVLKPFLTGTKIPYRIVLGNQATGKQYGIESMPDTFLIDRQGRIAAAYSGMVDRADVEHNLQAMLAQK